MKGVGTVIQIIGTGGKSLRGLWTSDPEYAYFMKADVTTYGFGKCTVTPGNGGTRLLVAIADVDAAVARGRLMKGATGLDVGDAVRVQLASTDVERGFIDFVPAEA